MVHFLTTKAIESSCVTELLRSIVELIIVDRSCVAVADRLDPDAANPNIIAVTIANPNFCISDRVLI
jgi:hypothetical protein